MFIANNSSFKPIVQYYLSRINSAEGLLPDDDFWKNTIYRFKLFVKMQI